MIKLHDERFIFKVYVFEDGYGVLREEGCVFFEPTYLAYFFFDLTRKSCGRIDEVPFFCFGDPFNMEGIFEYHNVRIFLFVD